MIGFTSIFVFDEITIIRFIFIFRNLPSAKTVVFSSRHRCGIHLFYSNVSFHLFSFLYQPMKGRETPRAAASRTISPSTHSKASLMFDPARG